MKKIATLALGAASLLAFASACSVDVADEPVEETGTSEEAVSGGMVSGEGGMIIPACFDGCATTIASLEGRCCHCTRTVDGVTQTINGIFKPTGVVNVLRCSL